MAFLKKKKRRHAAGRGRTDTVELTVDNLLHGPEGIGRLDGRAVFVARAVPGDRLKVRITEQKKSFWRAEIVNVLEPSPDRRRPPCHVFGRCGGCQWLHVDYERQVAAKQTNVLEALRRIGGFEHGVFDVQPFVPSPRKYHYRRRTRLRCRVIAPGTLAVGFKAAATHRVVSHDDCWLYAPTIRKALLTVGRRLGRALVDLSFLCHGACGGAEGAEVTSLALETRDQPLVGPLTDALAATAERLPLRYEVRYAPAARDARRSPPAADDAADDDDTDTPLAPATVVAASDEPTEVTYEVPGPEGSLLTMRADARSFFQANVEGNAEMVRTILDWAAPSPGDEILDLYCGVGNFSVPLAAAGATVLGVEVDPTCVQLARANGDAAPGLLKLEEGLAAACTEALADTRRSFDLIVVDPPREGARDVVPHLLRLRPRRIMYVSCDPATLARDLRSLADNGYRPARLRGFDLFPQTYHVETVVELVLDKEAQ